MKIVISEHQLRNIIIKEQKMGGSSSYVSSQDMFDNNPDKFWDVYVAATDQTITQINKNILVPCPGNDDNVCKQVRNYSPTDTLYIFNTGRVIVKNKSTQKVKTKGTMIAIDMDHFRINWDDGSTVEKKSDPNWSGGVNSNNTTNTNSTCASSFDELKKGSGKLLQKGCKSNTVKQLQTMLGMEQKFQTGLFGDITKGKVIEFQKTHKDSKGIDLKPDGIVGEKTYNSLKSST